MNTIMNINECCVKCVEPIKGIFMSCFPSALMFDCVPSVGSGTCLVMSAEIEPLKNTI